MTDEIIKQVPSVIEDPIIVMESKTVPGRITMFGELADADVLQDESKEEKRWNTSRWLKS